MPQTYSTESHYPLPFSLLAPSYFLRYPNPFAQHVLSVDVLERRIVQRPVEQPSGGSASSSSSPPTKPVLLTARLILKKGTLPSWAPRGLIKNAESWVLEVSEVDLEAEGDSVTASTAPTHAHTRTHTPVASYSRSPFAGMFERGWGRELRDETARGPPPTTTGRQMRTWTRNLDHTTVLAVAEGLTFTEVVGAATTPDKGKGKGKGKEKEAASLPALSPSTAAESQTHCLTAGHVTSDVAVLRQRIEKFGLKRFKAHMDTSRQGLLHTASALSPTLYPHSSPAPPPPSALTRLRESLRPPWLDGLPLGPVQSLRRRIRAARENWGGGASAGAGAGWPWAWPFGATTGERKEREAGMARWREKFRERFLLLRGQRGEGEGEAAGVGVERGSAGKSQGEGDR